jgi:hypothetical protein
MEQPNPSFTVIYHCHCTHDLIILYGPRETFSTLHRSVLAIFDISRTISECPKCCSDADAEKRIVFRKLRNEGSRIYMLWMEGVRVMIEKGFVVYSEARYTYTGRLECLDRVMDAELDEGAEEARGVELEVGRGGGYETMNIGRLSDCGEGGSASGEEKGGTGRSF